MATGVGIAAWLGDQVGYTLGRHYGRPYLDKRKGQWLQNAIAKSEKFYLAWGWWAVVIARFMPWARVFIPVIAGISKMNYYKFFSANLVGALAWGVGLTLAGYYAATIPVVKNASYGIAIFFISLSILAGIRVWVRNRRSAKN
jgi:membrane-associated protein